MFYTYNTELAEEIGRLIARYQAAGRSHRCSRDRLREWKSRARQRIS